MAKIVRDIFIGNFGISQKFGENPKDYAKFGMLGHNGVDFRCPQSTILIAGTQGLITKVKYDQFGYGWFVELWDNAQFLVTIYAHLLGVGVSVGQWILAGQRIGSSNNTGNSTGPHLHFGVGDTNDKGVRQNQNNGYYGWFDPLDKNRLKWAISSPSTVDEAVRNANPKKIAVTVDVPVKNVTIEAPKLDEEKVNEVAAPLPQPSGDVTLPDGTTGGIEGPFTKKDVSGRQTYSNIFGVMRAIAEILLTKIFQNLSRLIKK